MFADTVWLYAIVGIMALVALALLGSLAQAQEQTARLNDRISELERSLYSMRSETQMDNGGSGCAGPVLAVIVAILLLAALLQNL